MVLQFVDSGGGVRTFAVQNLSPGVDNATRVESKTAPNGQVYKWVVGPKHGTSMFFSTTDSWSECSLGTYKLGSPDSLNTMQLQFEYVTVGSNEYLNVGFNTPKVDVYNLNWGSIINLPAATGKCCFAAFDYNGDTYIGVFMSSTGENEKFYAVGGLSINFFEPAIASPYQPNLPYGGAGGNEDENGGLGNGIPDGDRIGGYNALDETAKQAVLSASGLNAYVVDGSNLAKLANFLWGKDSNYWDAFWQRWENYKFNPMAGIVSCHRVPQQFYPNIVGTVNVRAAGVEFNGVSQGTVAVTGRQFYNNRIVTPWYTAEIKAPAMDFTDFAGVEMGVYLPFIGDIKLNPAQCMGGCGGGSAWIGSISVQYCCNILTGDIGAIVETSDQFGFSHIAGSGTGNCREDHMLSGNDNGMGQVLSGAFSTVLGAVSGAASGGVIGAVGGAASGIAQMVGAPHHTQTTGTLRGAAGWCAQTDAYVYMYYNVPILPEDQAEYAHQIGRPSMRSGTVNSFEGYNQLKVHADSISLATAEEKAEIESLCASGVIV